MAFDEEFEESASISRIRADRDGRERESVFIAILRELKF
jgi:hypothetical protein